MFGLAIWSIIGLSVFVIIDLALLMTVAGILGVNALIGTQATRIAYVIVNNIVVIWAFNLSFGFQSTFTIVLCALTCLSSTGSMMFRLLKNDTTKIL